MNEFFKGKLQRWNDTKGFGFIIPDNGNEQIFIHISALKNMNRRPMVGDVIWYQLSIDNDGKTKAVNARIDGVAMQKKKTQRSKTSFGQLLSNLIAIVFIIALGIWGYQKITQHFSIRQLQSQQPSTEIVSFDLNEDRNSNYHCDGRIYCSQMTSREEAEYFVSHCPGTQMDGDHDGEPCENDSRF